jgi:hypothetical protein
MDMARAARGTTRGTALEGVPQVGLTGLHPGLDLGPGRPRGAEPKGERCGACGSRHVRIDAVDAFEPGEASLRLAECAHCDHRWTRREIVAGAVVRSAPPAARVADAA